MLQLSGIEVKILAFTPDGRFDLHETTRCKLPIITNSSPFFFLLRFAIVWKVDGGPLYAEYLWVPLGVSPTYAKDTPQYWRIERPGQAKEQNEDTHNGAATAGTSGPLHTKHCISVVIGGSWGALVHCFLGVC